MKNAANWFVIPVTDIERAKKFYDTLLDADLQIFEMSGMKSAFLPADLDNGATGGSLVQGESYVPSAQGTLVYLNGGEDLSIPLSKVVAAGGEILMQKSSIGASGFMACFRDTEGNTVGLHSVH